MSTPSKPLPTTPCRSGSSTAYQPLSEASLKRLVEHAVKGAVAQAVDQVLAHRFAYEQNLRAKQERKADELQAKMGNLSTQLEQLQGNLSTQVEQLQAQLTAQDARADDYKRKMEGFEQQIARYQQQSGRREAQLEKYEQRLEAREGRIERRLHEMEEREARTKKEVSDMRQELNGSSLRLESGLGGLVAAFNGVQDSLASETNRSFFWVHNKCQELLDTTKTSYSNEVNKVFDTVHAARAGGLDGYTFTVIPPVSANAPGKRSSNANPRSNTRPNESAHADSPSRSSLKHSSSASPHPLTRSRLVKKVRIQESHSPATSLPPHAGTSRLRSLSDQSHLPPPPVTNIARTEEVLLYWDDELGMHAVRRIWIIAEDEK
ncbi:hypothetical protein BJY59DRAFT_725778 [Rhodotorula toruloides]